MNPARTFGSLQSTPFIFFVPTLNDARRRAPTTSQPP